MARHPVDLEAGGARSIGAPPRVPVPLDVRTDGVHVGPELQAHLLDRTARQLGARAGRLDRVTIRLIDLNGPRGGVDVECRIELGLRGSPTLFVSKRADRARIALDRTLDAARAALERAVRGRSPPREPADVERREPLPTSPPEVSHGVER